MSNVEVSKTSNQQPATSNRPLRYERKYVLENVPLFDILQMVKLHPEAFREIYPMRRVNNIYFDTVNFAAYQDNIMGIAHRTKFRIRWYGNHFEQIHKPVLEEKVKHGELGYKNTRKLADTDWEHIADEACELPQIEHRRLVPVLLNSYQRYYYGSPDGRFRLTVDENMTFGRFEKSLARMPYLLAGKRIIEIKYDQEYSKEADRISQYLPLRPTKHSKYVFGIQASYH
jgi:hypothetical protein